MSSNCLQASPVCMLHLSIRFTFYKIYLWAQPVYKLYMSNNVTCLYAPPICSPPPPHCLQVPLVYTLCPPVYILFNWSIFISRRRRRPRDGRYCNAPPSVRLSIRLSVRPSRLVLALQLKKALLYFLETLQVRAPSHGGVLYSFWYWWNVVWIFYEFFKYWKKLNLKHFVSKFYVFFAFHAISNIKFFLV